MTERSVGLAWAAVFACVAVVATCCAGLRTPTSYPRRPERGAYPQLVVIQGPEMSWCSWGKVDSRTAVTARHCVGDGQGWLLRDGTKPGAPSVCVDPQRDSAYLSIDSGAPAAPTEPAEVEPRVGEGVCYEAFTGRKNCGAVVRLFDDRFSVLFGAPVLPGESGSPVVSARGLVGVVSRRVQDRNDGVAARLPRSCQ